MFVEMWGFRRLLLSSNARIISNAPYACGAGFRRLLLSSNAPYACGAGFQLSLLNSISVIVSGFSFCLRRGTFVGRKYPKASAFLKESSQRTKNIFPCYPSPVSLSRRYSEFSMGRSSSLTPPRVRLRSSNSLLYSACAVLSKNPSGGNPAVIVKLQHK